MFSSALLAYAGLFFAALIAATLLPTSSEAVLATMLFSQNYSTPLLLALAITGNTLGSVINWLLGRYLIRFRGHRYFPFSNSQYAKAEATFQRYGMWSLLFAWLPIVGDPLTLIAGALGTRFWPFLFLVGVGKSARYIVVWQLSLWGMAQFA